jgi:hypothetical protein
VAESDLVFGPFDPSVVREPRANYAVSREISSFRNDGNQRADPLSPTRST